MAEARDESYIIGLIKFHITAAVAVKDDKILLKRFEVSNGFMKKTLTWVKMYLTTQPLCLSVEAKTSPDVHSHCVHHGNQFWDQSIIVCILIQLVKLVNACTLNMSMSLNVGLKLC